MVLGRKSDALYMFGYGAGFFFWTTKLLRRTLVVNCDGMEWMRPKFSCASRWLLRLSERLGLTASDAVVADLRCVAKYIERTYRRPVIFLPYGTPLSIEPPAWDAEAIERWRPGLSTNIKPDGYYLVLCRMEPDNDIDKIMESFALSRTRRNLLLVGPCISKSFLSHLREVASRDSGQILAGPLYDAKTNNMLRWHCAAYVHTYMVGGTNPSPLEALAAGNVVIGTDVEFNRELVGNGENLLAFFFRPDPLSVAQVIDKVAQDLLSLRKRARTWGPVRIREEYNWQDIIHEYRSLFEKL